jgi:hypothetical protein
VENSNLPSLFPLTDDHLLVSKLTGIVPKRLAMRVSVCVNQPHFPPASSSLVALAAHADIAVAG